MLTPERRHILGDIAPYICLFDDCAVGDTLIQSADEWMKHMQWSHTVVWCCLAPGHESNIYDSSTELEEHIRTHHLGSFTESQLPSLIQRGARPAPDTLGIWAKKNFKTESPDTPFNYCVLCHNFQTKTQTDSPGESSPPSGLHDHLLKHLETVALLSLPETEAADDVSFNSLQSLEVPVVDTPPVSECLTGISVILIYGVSQFQRPSFQDAKLGSGILLLPVDV
jgi:hypothetical protein